MIILYAMKLRANTDAKTSQDKKPAATFSKLLWKTSLEYVARKILGKGAHSRNIIGKIFGEI